MLKRYYDGSLFLSQSGDPWTIRDSTTRSFSTENQKYWSTDLAKMLAINEISLFPEFGRKIAEMIEDLIKVLYFLIWIGQLGLVWKGVIEVPGDGRGEQKSSKHQFRQHCVLYIYYYMQNESFFGNGGDMFDPSVKVRQLLGFFFNQRTYFGPAIVCANVSYGERCADKECI